MARPRESTPQRRRTPGGHGGWSLSIPVVYYADVDPGLRGQLRSAALAEDVERLTGLRWSAGPRASPWSTPASGSATSRSRDRHGRPGRAAAVRADRRVPAAQPRPGRAPSRRHRRRAARRGGAAHRLGSAGPRPGGRPPRPDDGLQDTGDLGAAAAIPAPAPGILAARPQPARTTRRSRRGSDVSVPQRDWLRTELRRLVDEFGSGMAEKQVADPAAPAQRGGRPARLGRPRRAGRRRRARAAAARPLPQRHRPAEGASENHVTRFEPTRAGIINMWDYRDEEFCFADGWLVLRGPNGSGKTKALEVLFPFVLDGRIDPKRLNPFAAEDRTMKSNLLYRGGENAVGYVWLEFRHAGHRRGRHRRGRPARAAAPRHPGPLALRGRRPGGRGLLAHHRRRPADDPQAAGRTDRRGRPCSGSPTEYRAAIDPRLFGLGAERYEQLLTLILTLRRPQLAKNLDPVEAVRHPHRRPAPGRRRPDRRGGPLVRRHGGGRHHAGGPGRRRRGHPGVPGHLHDLPAHPRPVRPPTRSPGAARRRTAAPKAVTADAEARARRPRQASRQQPSAGRPRTTPSPGSAPGPNSSRPAAPTRRWSNCRPGTACPHLPAVRRRGGRRAGPGARPRPPAAVPSANGRRAPWPTCAAAVSRTAAELADARQPRRASAGSAADAVRAGSPSGPAPGLAARLEDVRAVRAADAEHPRPSRPATWPGSPSTGRQRRAGRRRAGRAGGRRRRAAGARRRGTSRSGGLGAPARRAAPGRRLAAELTEALGGAIDAVRRAGRPARSRPCTTARSQPPSRPSATSRPPLRAERAARRGRTGPAMRGAGRGSPPSATTRRRPTPAGRPSRRPGRRTAVAAGPLRRRRASRRAAAAIEAALQATGMLDAWITPAVTASHRRTTATVPGPRRAGARRASLADVLVPEDGTPVPRDRVTRRAGLGRAGRRAVLRGRRDRCRRPLLPRRHRRPAPQGPRRVHRRDGPGPPPGRPDRRVRGEDRRL